jgi:selenide,water dikinase
MANDSERLRLTRFSHGAGCACKLGQAELARILEPIREHPAVSHPDLLVGFGLADDAGVFDLGNGTALVQTVDFFTPVVDEPYEWGRIAAANALSDVYAMGGQPLTALQLLGWPRDVLSWETAGEVQRGGADVAAKAGCTLVGGHSVDLPEPVYGLAVTGLVDPARMLTNAGARPGDALVLTKPLGIGIITTAIKREICPPGLARQAIDQMATLNEQAAGAALECGAHAATDVTGFGLLGHLREMLLASGAAASIDAGAVPVLDGTWDLLAAGAFSGGSGRNLAAVRPHVAGAVDEPTLRVLADAQTSGGLLVALPLDRLAEMHARLPQAIEVGRITLGDGTIEIT